MFNKKQRAQKYAVGGKVIHLYASLEKCVFREVTKVDTVADSRILRGNVPMSGSCSTEGSVSISHQTSTRLLK